MKHVSGWEGLAAALAEPPALAGAVLTIGMFDGLHRGHQRILSAAARIARSAGLLRVHVGFEPHPDLLIQGRAPLALMADDELSLRMAAAGVEVWVNLDFTPEFRETHWKVFVERLVDVTRARSIVLSPESALGRDRSGTLSRIRGWGASHGVQVHPVAEAMAGGAPIRSTRIREAIARGDLVEAARLLGRPYALTGVLQRGTVSLERGTVAVPPSGMYRARIGAVGRPGGRLPLHGRLASIHLAADLDRFELLHPGLALRHFEGGPVRLALLGSGDNP